MPSANSNPIPPIPKNIKIPTFTTVTKKGPDIEIPSSKTFYYACIQSTWLWWLVDLKLLRASLKGLAISPYDFGGGKGAVNINFFNAGAMYGNSAAGGFGGFNETEVNVVGFATKMAANVPKGISLKGFLTDGEPTKRVGNLRLWVACDDAVAVAAGRQIFFETTKFLCDYSYNVPSLNNPGVRTYEWTCIEKDSKAKTIYTATVNLAGLSPTPGNMSEWIDLSIEPKTKRPVGSRRNYLGMYNTYHLRPGNSAVTIKMGSSDLGMRKDMSKLIGSRKPTAIQTYESPACIAEAAGFYADV